MTVVALAAKFEAAWASQKTPGYRIYEGRLIFGLSVNQARLRRGGPGP
jgi:hypothetical protein